ncbi:hypothetical protein JCM14713_14300 [Desulfomicrobium salsuginis]
MLHAHAPPDAVAREKINIERVHMKALRNILAAGLVCVLATGCMYPGGRPDYTGSGALGGAAAGAAIGSLATHSGQGALLGGAIGAIAGGLIGHGMDAQQEARLQAQAPATYERVREDSPLEVSDVKELARAGVGDDLIISQIRSSRTVYHLDTAEIIDLKNSGVSERVIDFMINTPDRTDSAEVADTSRSRPPAPVPEPVFVAPGPGYVWVRGAWMWYDDHWAWHRGYWSRPHWWYGHGPRRHW